MRTLPLLLSYRRCPYAIRARLALWQAGVTVQVHEVSLRDKPAELLAARVLTQEHLIYPRAVAELIQKL